MSESFAELLEKSLTELSMTPGSIIKGQVVDISRDYVLVNVGLKSEALVPIEQFRNEAGELEISLGDEVDVALDAVEDGTGETRLSRERAKRQEAWNRLVKLHESGEIVMGLISGKVKGGFTVELGSVRAFLPGSLIDVRPLRDTSHLEGKEVELKVIKLDAKRNNVVVSRRAVLEASGASVEREVLLGNLNEGQVVKGIVKNLTDYGAFIDLGGVDGLLHITDMAWKRIKHPSEILSIGQEIEVKILKFDRERSRVSLGLKQVGEDPWSEISRRYPVGTRLFGHVTNIADYGCFVEIEKGVEGLVHVSEMDWTNKNVNPNKILQTGDEMEVMVLDIDEERRRISLGMKQCQANPWEAFATTHNKNDKVSGKVKSITDFGVFIGLEGGIDGLIHLSDISWDLPGNEAVVKYKKGDDVDAIVLSVDPQRERISLGIKQIEQDPYANYLNTHEKGSKVSGKVISIDAKGAMVELSSGISGYLAVSELEEGSTVTDITETFKQGDTIEAMLKGFDRKNRWVSLTLRSDADEEE
jgi:small subunit ribosomal protein S1